MNMTNAEHPTPPKDNEIELVTATWMAVVQTYNECTVALSERLSKLGLSLLQLCIQVLLRSGE